MSPLQRISLLLLLACAGGAHAQFKAFPRMKEIFAEFYQTEVSFYDVDRDYSAVATEYYDASFNRSVLDLLVEGNKVTYYYYGYTDDILEVNGTACTASPVDQSIVYYDPPFYGWVNREPFVIGPSSFLWMAQEANPAYVGTEVVRGITCDYYNLKLDAKMDKVDIKYYFAVKEWTTPFNLTGYRVPIRIEVHGETSRTSEGHVFEDVNQIIDFTYFRLTISDRRKLKPPYGIGCFGLGSDDPVAIPKLPIAFKYSAQVHDILKTNEPDSIVYERVYFDNRTQLARLDTWSKKERSSVIYDFVDGVQYSVEDKSKCSIKAIRSSMFVLDDGHLLNYVKSPQQILGLTGDFYFMGYTMHRGIPCSVFETAKRNVYYDGKSLKLLVVTVFFTQDYTEVIVDGEDLMKSPAYLLVTGYDRNNNIALKKQFNIFGFDDISGETLYNNFPIEACFPLNNQRNYFVMVSKGGDDKYVDEVIKPLQKNNYVFLSILRTKLVEALSVSDLRIPFLKADYSTDGVYITGLLLDRPPALSQFWLMYKIRVKLGRGLRLRENVRSREECAYTCVSETGFRCRGFHYCGATCFTASNPIDQDPVGDQDELHECEIYIRGLGTSTNDQLYLMDAISLLNGLAKKQDFVVPVPVDDDNTVVIKFMDIVVDDGPFTKDTQDKLFKVTAENYQLHSEAEIETTLDKTDYDTLLDCYKICEDEKSISCGSFSFCPSAKNKQCRISSLIVTGSETDYVEQATGCNVYSVPFLEMFKQTKGLTPLIPGEKAFRQILSAEECARKCLTYGEFKCKGFEYCKAKKNCVLHHKHALDLTKEEFGVGGAECVHYSAKYVADYIDMGKITISEVSKTEQGVSIEECAKSCSEELPSCRSFNYCPASEIDATDSSCGLSTKTLATASSSSSDGAKCHLYTRRSDVEKEGWDAFKLDKVKETQSSNMAGVVVGTLIFGLIVGIAAAIGYSYFRSKRSNSGDGMAIRFMKS